MITDKEIEVAKKEQNTHLLVIIMNITIAYESPMNGLMLKRKIKTHQIELMF